MESKIKLIGDPKYIGPGVWYIIHLKAKDATNDKRIDQFIDFMYMLTEKFSCKNCRKHMTAYINDHPMENLRYLENDKGVRIGMFKWSWLFHNAVNTRIHKPFVDWETAWEMYDNPDVCSKSCEETNNNDNNNITSIYDAQYIKELPSQDIHLDRKSKLAQSYFMKVGVPETLRSRNISIPDNTVSFASIR